MIKALCILSVITFVILLGISIGHAVVVNKRNKAIDDANRELFLAQNNIDAYNKCHNDEPHDVSTNEPSSFTAGGFDDGYRYDEPEEDIMEGKSLQELIG